MKEPSFCLRTSRLNWHKLSLLMLGVDDAQTNRGLRVLTIRELILMKEIGGDLMRNIVFEDHSVLLPAVPLTKPKLAVLLTIIRWYEDNLLATKDLILQKYGEPELISRYERLTELTRAVQNAPQINSDQLDR